MVHQDRTNLPTAPASLEDVFHWLLPADFPFTRHGNAVVEARILAAQAVAVWGWASGRTLDARMDVATPAVQRFFSTTPPVATRQGLCQALATCGDDLVAQLSTQIFDRLRGLTGCWTTAGRPTFAVDGSKFTAPRTAANQAAFAAATDGASAGYATKADAAKAQSVQVLLTIFWHIGSGLPACWQLAPSNGSERTIAADMLEQLPPDARIVGDAEYVGYPFWSALLDSGRTFVVRVGANVRLLENLDVRRGQRRDLVHCWPQDAQRAGLPPIPLRLISVRFSKSRTIWLLTNEFDLDHRRAKELYAARWGIEVFFRTVKQNCGKAKLLCRTPEHVRAELQWMLLGTWAALFVARLSFRARRQRVELLSPVQVLDAFAAALLRAGGGGSLEDLDLAECRNADESQRTTSKASRRYPRKKKRRPCGKPKLRKATKDEIEAAQAFL